MMQTEFQRRSTELFNLCEDVYDEASFLVFAKCLERHRKDVESVTLPNDWEHGSIAYFLDGAIAWAEDSEFGRGQGLSDENPWKKFAAFLYGGKIYE